MGCRISVQIGNQYRDNNDDDISAKPFDKDKYKQSLEHAEDNLENFVSEAITYGNFVEAVKKFLQNEGALISFMEFLKSEQDHDAGMFTNLQKNSATDSTTIESAANHLVNKYTFPGETAPIVSDKLSSRFLPFRIDLIPNSRRSVKRTKSNSVLAIDKELSKKSKDGSINSSDPLHLNIINFLSRATTSSSSKSNLLRDSNATKKENDLKDAYLNAQREALLMVAIDSLPRYLESDYYKLWREDEVTNTYIASKLIQDIESKPLQADLEKNPSISYIRRAFAALDPLEVPNIARSSFLSVFLGSVEGLPISVSLSTANPKRPGFPLIYVNAIFEETTGYARKEIIGRNCRFLQAGKAEEDSIAKLSTALCDAKPVKVKITNYRKNGEPFLNLLAMKPIFDQNGKYAYVVGLQFDISNEESASIANLQYIDHLLSMLPDRLPFDDINQ